MLIASGSFGLLIYHVDSKKQEVKKAKTASGYIGINYIAELNIILAATQKRIDLINPDNLDDGVMLRGQSLEYITTTLAG